MDLRLVREDPLGPTALFAAQPISIALARARRPSSPSISSTTLPLTVSRSTTPTRTRSMGATVRIPAPSSSTTIFWFAVWSAIMGQVNMGTPAERLSKTEFQPQCVKKPPTAGWDSISHCGVHSLNTSPLPARRSSSPSGANHVFDLTTSTNGQPLASSPHAISVCWLSETGACVPKEA
uniref:Uncharacterized protein n=1 Tax=Nymphaea colorata TaxID=210225 RepID=A0A5K0YDP1_9MAGN|nr:unnamed protein product [Nymphaea colorata]